MDHYDGLKSNPDQFPQIAIRNSLFLHYRCPQKEYVIQLYAKHMQFNFTLSGKRIFHHGAHTWKASSGKGMIIKRGAFLQELPADYEWDVLAFYLKDEYLRAIFDELQPYLSLENLPDPSDIMIESIAIDDRTRKCYESFIPYFGNNKGVPDSILDGKIKELLFYIFSNSENKHLLAYILKINAGYRNPIWEVMEENYMYDLNLSDFAKIANRSLSTFKREFESYYKMSPGRWLTQRRLERAKSFLETTDKSIGEIVFDCGFNNASHFSRIFKEHFHESPSAYSN